MTRSHFEHPVYDGHAMGQNAAKSAAVEYVAVPGASRSATYVCAHGETPAEALVDLYLTARTMSYSRDIPGARNRLIVGAAGTIFIEARKGRV